MRIYFNPGNSGFQRILNSEYVDKTGLIRQINDSIGTVTNLRTFTSNNFTSKVVAVAYSGIMGARS